MSALATSQNYALAVNNGAPKLSPLLLLGLANRTAALVPGTYADAVRLNIVQTMTQGTNLKLKHH